jgi:hypothetical protein
VEFKTVRVDSWTNITIEKNCLLFLVQPKTNLDSCQCDQEAIFLIRQLIERCREQKKDLHLIFIDLEKAYDKVSRNVMWWTLQKHKVSSKYITLIKNMYDNVVISVRTSNGDTNDFPINIGLHQGSALSPYLFALVMDEVTRDMQGGIPWCMLFANDVVLVDESRMGG